jgi:hypothetical protein
MHRPGVDIINAACTSERAKALGGSDFLNKVYYVCAILTLVVCSIVWAYLGRNTAIASMVGGCFVIINMMIIGRVVRALVKPEERSFTEIALALFFKFPVVYGFLVIAFLTGIINPIGFAIGFTILPIALVTAAMIPHFSKTHGNFYEGGEAK